MEYHITDDLEKLKAVLPVELVDSLEQIGNIDELVEVILDLGRQPTARYTTGERLLAENEITHDSLQYVISKIGAFDADNRAGLERTLHRISAIRNRRGDIVGLTCRIGRAVYGTIDIIQDLIESGQSVLLLGAPGVGKTTMLREAARVLAENKRVIIVDTSNEIGGDGDVPHPAVGKARRMQVPQPSLQHEVMIEAVENHNPEVIVIDEIGRELEAMAARTIAERGVQLIGTAHGQTLENLMLNPTLSDLIGGIKAVTLSDEEARRRGTQKTVLERAAPPTFDVLIEIQTRNRLVIHEDIAASVDSQLRFRPLPVEIRYRDENGELVIETQHPVVAPPERQADGRRGGPDRVERLPGGPRREGSREDRGGSDRGERGEGRDREPRDIPAREPDRPGHTTQHIYAYGVARNRLYQAAKRMRLPLMIEDDFGSADAVVTLKNYYRRRPKLIIDAERRRVPIYVLRANTITQMEDFLSDLFHLDRHDQPPEPFESDADDDGAYAERPPRTSRRPGGQSSHPGWRR
ncbi:MAG: AAA family ATPase [Anaerolineae bacterium]|nr:AAA family ATPase [Anaerolineae bacterium]